jgi:hypothetical protein
MPVLRRTLSLAAACALASCATEEPLTAPTLTFHDFGLEAPVARPATPLVRLTVPTYEGSGEAVHPDVLWFPQGWHGWEYWMAFTPYPKGEERYENPSLAVSHDGVQWEVPAGLANPIVPPLRHGFNSDPDLSYDAAHDRLVLLTRQVRGGFNLILALSSPDGVTWTAPRLLFRRPSHGIISPAMVLSPSGAPMVWYVDAGSKPCPSRVTRILHQSAASGEAFAPAAADRGWSAPRVATLEQPGYFIWHLDVTRVEAKNEYWAMYPAYDRRGCGARDLFFARSADGITWTTYPRPILRHEDARWTSAMLYRASALYDPATDRVRIFLSGAAPGPAWHLGYVEFGYAQLLAGLQGAGTSPTDGRKGPSRLWSKGEEGKLP